jgi:pimeloyl-ACP methyl ester carboxylesterase
MTSEVELEVERLGEGSPVLFVHGDIVGPSLTWRRQRDLAARWSLIIPSRPGFGESEPLERNDFELEAPLFAELLGDGAHLVGHSYGGVISLLIAARHPGAVRSLTVNEPPAFGVARGRPEIEKLVAGLDAFFQAGPHEPAAFLRGFLALVGSDMKLPDPLPPELEQGIRASMAERPPWEAEIPLDELAAAPFPKLVVSGAHNPAFDAVCDVLEERLGAERAVLPGAGHSLPRAPGYAERLEGFLSGNT